MKIIPKLLFFVLMAHIVIFDKAIAQEKRIALVIGNAAYVNGSSLKNPVNDANLMAVTLQQLGFEVKKLTNASLKQMQDAAVDFTNKIGQFDVTLFYYAGHGIQLEGTNYLIPVDAKLDDKLRAKYEAFDISDINYAFAQNSGKMNIMILDACRDNPFRSWMRGGERGFQAIGNQATGTIIAFATREGQTAADGSGNNGLYTEKLVEQLKIAQNVNDVFKNTRVNVLKASNNAQCPQEWDMSVGSFYFSKSSPMVKPAEVTVSATDEVVEYYYGSLELKTELSGKLYLDGSFQKDIGTVEEGTRKIITLSNIKTGSHTIEIQGSENWKQTVSIYKDQTAAVTAISSQASVEAAEYTESALGLNIKMVKVKGGSFLMGSPTSETYRESDEVQHSVSLSDYYIGKYEVTQKQWQVVMGSNPSYFKNCDQCPVEMVSWDDIQEFIKKLNQQTGKKYALPSEAQWEYAARGGIKGKGYKYSGNNDIGSVAWYTNNSGSKTHAVGQKQPNELGIYDMSGNVWEWCSDYCNYESGKGIITDTYKSGVTNPICKTGSARVFRGGSWYLNAQFCRSASRYDSSPDSRNFNIGFRLVCVP